MNSVVLLKKVSGLPVSVYSWKDLRYLMTLCMGSLLNTKISIEERFLYKIGILRKFNAK
jgi:hypothetical protein